MFKPKCGDTLWLSLCVHICSKVCKHYNDVSIGQWLSSFPFKVTFTSSLNLLNHTCLSLKETVNKLNCLYMTDLCAHTPTCGTKRLNYGNCICFILGMQKYFWQTPIQLPNELNLVCIHCTYMYYYTSLIHVQLWTIYFLACNNKALTNLIIINNANHKKYAPPPVLGSKHLSLTWQCLFMIWCFI